MKLKKQFMFSVIIVLLIFCSCNKGGSNLKNDLEIQVSPPEKSLIDLTSTIYDDSQLTELSKFGGSIEELDAKYPIQCLRENNGAYRVSYRGKEKIAVLLFDNIGNKLLGNVYSCKLLKSDFANVTKGQLLEDIRKIDPDGEYLFLYTGRNDAPKTSSHYTKDGFLITIEYDSQNNVFSIDQELV